MRPSSKQSDIFLLLNDILKNWFVNRFAMMNEANSQFYKKMNFHISLRLKKIATEGHIFVKFSVIACRINSWIFYFISFNQ